MLKSSQNYLKFINFKCKHVYRKIITRSINKSVIDITKDVESSLSNKTKPVVALESTIITHGMPYPYNLETAIEVEEIVKSQGAIPATIGIVDGKVKVGLNRNELKRLATLSHETTSSGEKVVKTSRRDFSYVISKGLCGGTTVSGTIVVCNLVGIDIFVTGGIGGVHRDVNDSMDVSADLVELSRNRVTVVSSGVKSILDIQRTLEYLETLGVCVVTYGENNNFPAFYSRDSGFKAPYNASSIAEAADMVLALHNLNMKSGLLLAVPIPSEYCVLDHETIENVIQDALKEAKEKNIKGKKVTPFLLGKVNQSTGQQLLKSNIGLIKNNALVGSQLAVKLHDIKKAYHTRGYVTSSIHSTPCTSWSMDKEGIEQKRKYSYISDCQSKYSMKYPVVIGGSNLDCIVTACEDLKVIDVIIICKGNPKSDEADFNHTKCGCKLMTPQII